MPINEKISYINGKLTVEFTSMLKVSTNAICWADVSLRKTSLCRRPDEVLANTIFAPKKQFFCPAVPFHLFNSKKCSKTYRGHSRNTG